MIYAFGQHELDDARRELRRGGEPVALQPQVFDLLAFLLAHRDRVVSKDELLAALWPDAVVTEGSLQRAISLARAALGDDREAIRTFPRVGYRFVGDVVANARRVAAQLGRIPRPRFALAGDAHIAYCTLGEGPVDIVLVLGWTFPLTALFDQPELAVLCESFAKLGRVILFDKRGTGLSDRARGLPDLERRSDDLRAVLDAVDSRKAVLVGISEGGPLSIVFAASNPERVRGLLLVGSFARMRALPGELDGITPFDVDKLRHYLHHDWGRGATLAIISPRRANDPDFLAWAARNELAGASPGAALDLLEMNLEIDVRPLLSSVRVPTTVIHSAGDSVLPVAQGRYLGAHIPHARYRELPGGEHVPIDESELLTRELADVIARDSAPPLEDFLTTALVCLGTNGPPRDFAERVAAARGVPLPERLGAAYFDGPARALACARGLASRDHRLGLHTGLLQRSGTTLGGPALEIAGRIAAGAPPGEVRLSHVVADLLPGTGHRFMAVDRASIEWDGRPWSVVRLLSDS